MVPKNGPWPFFRLDKLESYSGQSLVFLSNICLTLKYHDIQIFWMKQGAWTNSGQTMDFSESKDCPSLIRLQGDQVANKKNIESQLWPPSVQSFCYGQDNKSRPKGGPKVDKNRPIRTIGGLHGDKTRNSETKTSQREDQDKSRARSRHIQDLKRTMSGHGTKIGQKLGSWRWQPAPGKRGQKIKKFCGRHLSMAPQIDLNS